MIREGMTAVVTGGAQGIGRSICFALAKRGVCVYSLDVNDNGNRETENQMNSVGSECYAVHCDVSDTEEIRKTFERTRQPENCRQALLPAWVLPRSPRRTARAAGNPGYPPSAGHGSARQAPVPPAVPGVWRLPARQKVHPAAPALHPCRPGSSCRRSAARWPPAGWSCPGRCCRRSRSAPGRGSGLPMRYCGNSLLLRKAGAWFTGPVPLPRFGRPTRRHPRRGTFCPAWCRPHRSP